MTDFLDKITDASEQARLRRQGAVTIWLAVRECIPHGHISGDMLASASRISTHYALGEIDELSRDTIFIKAGFRLGILQAVQNVDGSIAEREE